MTHQSRPQPLRMSVETYSTNMAAMCYVRAVRAVLKGVHPLLAPNSRVPSHCRRPQPRVSPVASLCTSSAEPRKGTRTEGRRAREEEEDLEGPEYMPTREAKNPMRKIGYAWMIGLPTGILTFLLAKREVDKNRLKQLKVRQRMGGSNEGEYEGSRYRHHSKGVNVDQ